MVQLVCFEYFRFQNNPLKLYLIRASLVAQMVKNLPAMWETWVQSLGWEDPLEKGMATHSSHMLMMSSQFAPICPLKPTDNNLRSPRASSVFLLLDFSIASGATGFFLL